MSLTHLITRAQLGIDAFEVRVEVHISNIHARESFRHQTVTGGKAIGCIAGLGLAGYAMAIQYLIEHCD